MPFDLVLTDVLVIGGTVVAFWAIRTYIQYLRIVKSIDHIAGPRVFFSAATVTILDHLYQLVTAYHPYPTSLSPDCSQIYLISTERQIRTGKQSTPVRYQLSPNSPRLKLTRMLAFQKYGLDILGSITFYPSPRVVLSIADPGTVKEVTTHRAAFPKPVQFYKMLNIFGSNILATEGDEWRMHRNVVAKSFTEQNNKLIWAETIDCISSLFATWEEESEKKGDREVVIESAADLTREITLMVLSATGTSA